MRTDTVPSNFACSLNLKSKGIHWQQYQIESLHWYHDEMSLDNAFDKSVVVLADMCSEYRTVIDTDSLDCMYVMRKLYSALDSVWEIPERNLDFENDCLERNLELSRR